MNPAEHIIAKFGGLTKLARALGCAVSTVQGWKERGRIPQEHWLQIIAAGKTAEIELSFEDFILGASTDATAGDPEILTDRIKREAEIAQWFALPIGAQPELFGDVDREPGEDRAAREGEAAGFAGKDCEPPYDANSPMGRAWSAAWKAAQEQMLSDLASAMEKRNSEQDGDELISGHDADDPFAEAAE